MGINRHRKIARSIESRFKTRNATDWANPFSFRPAQLYGNHSGLAIDEITALNLSGIWRGVNVLAGDMTKLPCNLYERLPNGGKQPNTAHPLFRLMNYPNRFQTGRKLQHVTMVHTVLFGNGYQEIIRDRNGNPIERHLLDPRMVKPRRDDNGELYYWLKGQASPWTGKHIINPENMLHFTGLTLNGDEGLSTIQMNAESLGIASALDRYAGTLWGNGAQPNGVIECPPGWPEDARNNFRQAWQDEHGGIDHANRVAILEEGAKWVATSFEPEKLQMLSARQFSVVEQARIIGLPPHKLGDYGNDIERSLEESNRDYYETSLEPYARTFEDEYAFKLLTVPDREIYFVQFDMSGLMRGSDLERAQSNDIKMRNGVITANEWRAEDGRNPFDDDVRLVPLNMVQVTDEAGPLAPEPVELDPTDAPMPDDPEPLASVADEARSVLHEALRRMIRREVLNVRKAHKRGDMGPEWLTTYYADHTGLLDEAVSPALRLYARATGLAIEPGGTLATWADESKALVAGATDLDGLLDTWEHGKADEFIGRLKGDDGRA